MRYFVASIALALSCWSSVVATAQSQASVQGLEGCVDLDAEHVWITSVDIAGRKGYLHQFN